MYGSDSFIWIMAHLEPLLIGGIGSVVAIAVLIAFTRRKG